MNEKFAKNIIDLGEGILKEISEKLPNNMEPSIEDVVVLGLYSGILEKSKSLIILCNNNSIFGTDSILRSILESKVYLEFILEKHTKDRAKAYEYSLVIQNNKRKKWLYEHLDKELLLKAGFPTENNDSEDFEKIKTEYLNLTKRYSKDGKGDSSGKKWYKVGGNIDTFEGLCCYMGDQHLKEYHIVFKTFSTEIHGRDADRFWDFIKKEDGLFFDGQEIHGIYEWIKTFGIEAIEIVARKYNIPMQKKMEKLLFINSQYNSSTSHLKDNN